MLSFKRTPQEKTRISFLNYQTGAKYVQQTTGQRMLSSEFGIKPNVTMEFADINAKFFKIFLKLPELSYFQKDAIKRTAFANDNSRDYQKNGTIFSMIDSYVGSGKTRISLLGAILYTLKEGSHIKESLSNEATKCTYYSDLDPRCSPLYCKGYRNIVAVCANHDLVPQWQNEANYVIHCIKDVVKKEFKKSLSMHVSASGKLQGGLKEYNDNELIILIMKQQKTKDTSFYSPDSKFLYDGNTSLNQIPDHSDKSNLNQNNFANIACSVLIADEAHLRNSIVKTIVQPWSLLNGRIVQRDRLPILLASHVIGVSASLYDQVDWTDRYTSKRMIDFLVKPSIFDELKHVIPWNNWKNYFKNHVASCIRCDHRMLQTYYDNIKKIKICTVNSHVPKGLGECEFELTSPSRNFKLFTDMMQKRYNIEISKDVFEQNLDINDLISIEKDNIKQLKTRISTIQEELKGHIPDDDRDNLEQLLKNEKELLEKKQIGIDNFIEFINKELECCICIETVNGDEDNDNDALMCSKCMNLFHRRCKEDWDNTLTSNGQKPSCPICREEAVGNQIAFVSKTCSSSTDDTIMVEEKGKHDEYQFTSLITLGEYMKEKMNNKSSQDSHLAHSLKGRISIVMTELFKFLNYNQNRFLKFMLVCKSEQETDIIEYFNREFKQYIEIEQLHIEIMKGAGTIKDGIEQRNRIDSFSKNGCLLLMMTFDSQQCNSMTGVDIPDLDGLISIGSSDYIVNDDQRAGRLIRMSRMEGQKQKLFINIRSFSADEIRKMENEESETRRQHYWVDVGSDVGNTCSSSSSNTNRDQNLIIDPQQQQIALTSLNQSMQLTQASSNSGKRKHSDITTVIDKDDDDYEEEEIVQAQKKERNEVNRTQKETEK